MGRSVIVSRPPTRRPRPATSRSAGSRPPAATSSPAPRLPEMRRGCPPPRAGLEVLLALGPVDLDDDLRRHAGRAASRQRAIAGERDRRLRAAASRCSPAAASPSWGPRADRIAGCARERPRGRDPGGVDDDVDRQLAVGEGAHGVAARDRHGVVELGREHARPADGVGKKIFTWSSNPRLANPGELEAVALERLELVTAEPAGASSGSRHRALSRSSGSSRPRLRGGADPSRMHLWLQGGATADAPAARSPPSPSPSPSRLSARRAVTGLLRRAVSRPELLLLLALAAP